MSAGVRPCRNAPRRLRCFPWRHFCQLECMCCGIHGPQPSVAAGEHQHMRGFSRSCDGLGSGCGGARKRGGICKPAIDVPTMRFFQFCAMHSAVWALCQAEFDRESIRSQHLVQSMKATAKWQLFVFCFRPVAAHLIDIPLLYRGPIYLDFLALCRDALCCWWENICCLHCGGRPPSSVVCCWKTRRMPFFCMMWDVFAPHAGYVFVFCLFPAMRGGFFCLLGCCIIFPPSRRAF